ncbi:MAG: phage tail tip lysozyme [Candidatus Saccharimonadales bacterium]
MRHETRKIRCLSLAAALALFLSFGSASASALSQTDLNNIIGNTPFYNPNGCYVSGSSSVPGNPDITGQDATPPAANNCVAFSAGDCASGVSASITGNNPKDAYKFFVQNGYTPAQAAGIVGNLMQESGGGVSPTAHTPGNPAYGIAQWQDARLVAMRTFVQGEGKNPSGLSGQLDYLLHELNGSESAAAQAVKATSTPKAAAVAFEQSYERAGIPEIQNRIANAQLVFKKYGGNAAGASSSGSAPTTSTAPSSGCSAGGSANAPGGCNNPFRDIKNLRPERIDQGVDYAGSGPVYAVCGGTITHLSGDGGWNFGGADSYIVIKISGGALDGKLSYMAEGCPPTVSIGQQVTSSTVICNLINPSSTGIETGWAASPTDSQPIAQLYGGNGSTVTTAGISYNNFLKSLGTPSGLYQGSTIGNALPAGYP